MVSLGLDVSTNVAGIAFVNQDNREILHASFLDISKVDINKEKVKLIIDYIEKLNIKFDTISLEGALSGFAGGKMKMQIIIKLARFNSLTEYIISEHFKITVQLVGATTARKQLFGKARLKGIPPKQFVKDNMDKMFDLKKFEVLNRNGDPDKKNEDMRDALVIAFYK